MAIKAYSFSPCSQIEDMQHGLGTHECPTIGMCFPPILSIQNSSADVPLDVTSPHIPHVFFLLTCKSSNVRLSIGYTMRISG